MLKKKTRGLSDPSAYAKFENAGKSAEVAVPMRPRKCQEGGGFSGNRAVLTIPPA